MSNHPRPPCSVGPQKSIFGLGTPGSSCVAVPEIDVPDIDLDALLGESRREGPPVLPHVTEVEVMRHYSHLAQMNFGVDSGFYPLGSCTMKYNPRINEDAARLEGFSGLHPYQPEKTVQGALRLMVELSEALAEISGLPGVTLQPAAGAHGELTALMCFRAAHEAAGDPRKKVILPDTAHGTNPATVAMGGWDVVTVPSNDQGLVDLDALKAVLDTDVAAFMLTNPNTLGLFDPQIQEITEAVHAVGAFAYCDGANLNAVLGKSRPGDQGFDALHINLHKTFSTPHGGGGPGAGPVCVSGDLAHYLPSPLPVRVADGEFSTLQLGTSVGRVRSFFGNFGVLVKAYAYIKALGAEGLEEVSEQAVLSANYLKEQLKEVFDLPYDRTCMHEFVLSGTRFKAEGVRTLDIAKRLLDYGFHSPTVYFPSIVDEAIMIEPTETESVSTLDGFVEAMRAIADEAVRDPDIVRSAPHTTPVRRLDEVRAARDPHLRWSPTQ
ncbi:MAG: aminomethyl-transferring glycine dehydrogenase subunit GcvPB [Coriobacteriia bacterium]|nr:aminomethyl-transferring glycine dehydrogenase subunit GcvPB [Coriobacteriia bacterium]